MATKYKLYCDGLFVKDVEFPDKPLSRDIDNYLKHFAHDNKVAVTGLRLRAV